MSRARRPLVVAVGNPLRGDDGVGAAVVERARADGLLDGAVVRSVIQLTPELAADVADAAVVVIVDARVGGPAGRAEWAEVLAAPGGGARPALSHHLSPAALLGLAAFAYGRVPPAFTLTVGGSCFEPGAGLSPGVAAAVDAAAGVLAALLAGVPAGRGSPARS